MQNGIDKTPSTRCSNRSGSPDDSEYEQWLSKRAAALGWHPAQQDFLNVVMTSGRASDEKTESMYRTHTSCLIAWACRTDVSLKGLKESQFRTFLRWRATTPSDKTKQLVGKVTLNKDARCCKRFLAWADRVGLIEHGQWIADIVVPREDIKLPNPPDRADLERIIGAVRDRWDPDTNPSIQWYPSWYRTMHADRMTAMLIVLMGTACRPGEMRAIRMQDYQPDRGRIYISHSKTNEARFIPVDANVIGAIDSWLPHRAKLIERVFRETGVACTAQWLFLSENGGQITADNLSNQYNRLRKGKFADLPGLKMYSFRTYGGTAIAERSVLAAQEMLGHKSLKTTQRYAHASFEHLKEVHEQAGLTEGIYKNKRTEARKLKRVSDPRGSE
jgi:integrase